MLKASRRNETARPAPIPITASARTSDAMRKAVGFGSDTAGQNPRRHMVSASANTILGASGADFMPGTGMNINTPSMRLKQSRKPNRRSVPSVISPGIAAEVPQQARCVGHHAGEHPRHKHNQCDQESCEPGYRAEARVLHGCNHLNEADHNSDHKPDYQ